MSVWAWRPFCPCRESISQAFHSRPSSVYCVPRAAVQHRSRSFSNGLWGLVKGQSFDRGADAPQFRMSNSKQTVHNIHSHGRLHGPLTPAQRVCPTPDSDAVSVAWRGMPDPHPSQGPLTQNPFSCSKGSIPCGSSCSN